MASKLDTEENNAALARGNLMSVKQALDVGLTENEIKKLIKMTNEKHNLTKREKDIVKNALEKATKKENELLRQVNKCKRTAPPDDGKTSTKFRSKCHI